MVAVKKGLYFKFYFMGGVVMKWFFVLVFAISSFAADAAFGLKWGQTPSELKKMNIEFTLLKGEDNFNIYKTKSLPGNLNDAESYLLFFYKDALLKIVFIGQDITSDITGSKGKARFEELTEIFKKKYTLVSSTKRVGLKLYDEYDEFYQCLGYSGCGLWMVVFRTETNLLMMELKGTSRGKGYIRIEIEGPGFEAAVDETKNKQLQKEESVF
jgi:hypothetical protein